MERAQQDFILRTLMELSDPSTSKCASNPDVEFVLREGHQNGSDMAEVSKAIKSALLTQAKIPQYGVHGLSQALPGLHKLGGRSREGFAYTMKVLNRRVTIVVKTPQKASRYRDAMREYVLGVSALNSLRDVIPTVLYTLGAFAHEKKVYTMYEHVPGKSIRELLFKEQINFEKWLSMFAQLLLTLEIAQQRVSFTHFDLHSENVLTRDTHGYVVPMDNDTYCVEAGLSPVVIDFGHACANVGGRCVGSHEHPNHGMISFTVPGNDMYKFLVSSLNAAKGGTQRRIAKLFQFYGVNDPYDIVSDITHVTNATNQFCREVTFNGVASHTPKEFLNWVTSRYTVKGFVKESRTMHVPIQVPKLACAKKLYRALAISQQCTSGGCIVPLMCASILKNYNAEHNIAHVDTVLKALETAHLNPDLDKKTLSRVFDVHVPAEVPSSILNIPIRASPKHKVLDLDELDMYIKEMSPYLKMYYIIVELNIIAFDSWVRNFKESKQFIFYKENITLISRVLRWGDVLRLSTVRNRF